MNVSNQMISSDEEYNLTSPSEIFSLTFVVPASEILFMLFMNLLPPIFLSIKAVLEAVVLNMMLLLCMTYWSNYLATVLVLLLVSILIFYGCSWKVRSESQAQVKGLSYCLKCILYDSTVAAKNLTESFITDYRGHLLLATSISILAVDFPVFPRKFAKTETYGWSVMDAGVGSFVFIHGLCSSSARVGNNKRLMKSLLSSLPLLFLGFVRLIAVTAVSYHTSLSEYGVHWNFFFTLALTKIVCSLILCVVPPSRAWLVSAGIVLVHQSLLLKGLTSFILNDDRSNIISANKEGICSLLGFIAIHFEGIQLGLFLWRKRKTMQEYWNLLFSLCMIGATGWISMYVLHSLVQPTSRRMANASYCVWVVTLTSLQLGVHLFLQLIVAVMCKHSKTETSHNSCASKDTLLWKAINYNGLFYFLIANLLTGLVNLNVNTESADTETFNILGSYVMILSVAVIVLLQLDIQIKFW